LIARAAAARRFFRWCVHSKSKISHYSGLYVVNLLEHGFVRMSVWLPVAWMVYMANMGFRGWGLHIYTHTHTRVWGLNIYTHTHTHTGCAWHGVHGECGRLARAACTCHRFLLLVFVRGGCICVYVHLFTPAHTQTPSPKWGTFFSCARAACTCHRCFFDVYVVLGLGCRV
jgi:hypothetical protein